MAALVKTNHYRVGYKFPRQKAVNMNYTAETLAMLMRNLQISEGVNRDTVEWLFVHQIMPTGTVLELIAIDGAQGINVTNIQSAPKAKVDLKEDIPFHEKDFNDWLAKNNADRENKILADVALLLNKAATSVGKPKTTIKAATPEKKQRRFIKGFHFSAKPAVATTET
jgi:hypothetical protein